MTLCPHAWPTPGSASYSAQIAMVSGPEPAAVATNAVGMSHTPASIVNGPLSASATHAAAALLLEGELGMGVHRVRQLDERWARSGHLSLRGSLHVHGASMART